MGMNEFDRIRSKNRCWNAADDELVRLRALKLADSDIVHICKTQLETNPTDARNEIFSTILKIMRNFNEEASIPGSDSI